MRRGSLLRVLLVVAVAVFFLPSCLALQPYQTPEIDTGGLYGYASVELNSTTLADMPWEEFFGDPTLRDLVAEALRYNLDLRSAIQQIRIARADFYEGKLALYPDLQADATASYSDQSDNSVNFGSELQDISIPPNARYTVSLSSTWQADIWGQLTSAKRAIFAALLETEATRRAVQTTLIADVAVAYYQIEALDRQVEITLQTVANRERDVRTVEALKEGAVLTGVDVQQSIANLYAARVLIPDLEQRITARENALSLLLGRKPGPIERTTLAQQNPLDSLATGVPAQLLRNRPDIIAAEYRFRNAFALTNNARTFFYPSLTLTAEGGLESLDLQDLLQQGSIFYNLIAGVTQPIFARGRNRARLERSQAQQEQALLGLRSAVLNAGSDVSNALSLYQSAEQRLEIRRLQLDALQRAVDYARELLRYGEANYLQVLTAQQNLLSAQLSQVNDELDRLVAGVNLYQALGGGWDRPENPIPPAAESVSEGDGTEDGN